MIELTDTIRAVEEFITPEGRDESDHGTPGVRVRSHEGDNSLALVRTTKGHDDTHAFGDMSVNVD